MSYATPYTAKHICNSYKPKIAKELVCSFDYSMANIIQYSAGSHEIVLGYNIGESIQRGGKKK